jgi:PAS domain S-box-containing protein
MSAARDVSFWFMRLRDARTIPLVAATAAGLIGAAGLLGWILDIAPLRSVLPGLSTMKANTAAAFVFSAAALRLSLSASYERLVRSLAQVLAVAVAAVGLLTLLEYLAGWNLGIDQLLFRNRISPAGTPYPGRMGANTAANFLLLGAALLLRTARSRRWQGVAEALALAAFAIALLALLGYAYNVTSLTGIMSDTQMAIHTALAFVILSTGVFFSRTDGPAVTLTVASGPGGMIVRRFVPATFVILFVCGAIRLRGQQAGLYGTEFGVALMVILSCTALTAVLLWGSTQLNRLEATSQRAERALRRSEAVLRQFVEHTPAAVAMFDRDMRYLVASKRWYTDYRLGDRDIMGRSHYEIFPEITERWKDIHRRCLAGAVEQCDEEPFPRADGGTDWVHWEVLPWRDDDGAIGGILMFTEVITARKRAEEELRRSNADLEQFAYVASHDLQEPLRMVASYTELLGKRYRGKLDADADEFIGYAVDGATRMQQLITDLLTYSRVGTRGSPFAPTDCEVVLTRVLGDLRLEVEQNRAVVTHDPLPTVAGDGTQLGQLFQNLVSNALKFHGPEPPRVHVSAERNGAEVKFAVRDNGIGIAPDHAERIFVIFQRLHTTAQYPGTGIGLALCKKIVERHGGRIWVESQPDQGATFYFTLLDSPPPSAPSDLIPPASEFP